jgi:nucleotide-binding universal stress UspA family protein
MFEKIMIATDGSDPSYQAAKQGVEMARIYGSEVTAVYVVDVKRLVQLPGYAGIPGRKDKLLAVMLDEGKEATREVEDMALATGVFCRKIVLKGHPSDELLRYSQEAKMDLLVMGSIGKSGLNRFLLGSVAEKVVQHSKVPIMLVPGNRDRSIDGQRKDSQSSSFLVLQKIDHLWLKE